MNPSDDDRYYTNDDNSDLFPNAGQRVSSHNFYNNDQIAAPSQPPQQQYQEEESTAFDEFCPRCDARLEIRESTLGKYIACTRFPDCRFTQPYDESDSKPTSYAADTKNDPYEKDYLQEAADEISHSSYEEPEESYQASDDQEEHATGLPPEPYYKEEEEEQVESFEPSIYDNQQAEPEIKTKEKQPEQVEEPPMPIKEPPVASYPTKKQPLHLHPGFLKKEDVSNSSRWAQLKTKRLRDQTMAALSPAEVAAQENMPSREELEETLKKLEEDVQKMQTAEGEQLQPHTEQKPSNPDYDEYDDDVLPPSLRQALREKSNNDY